MVKGAESVISGPAKNRFPRRHLQAVEENSQGENDSFYASLRSALGRVNDSLLEAEKAALRLATGDVDNIHDVMITMKKAEISLKLAASVRDRAIEAYQQIMRMQI